MRDLCLVLWGSILVMNVVGAAAARRDKAVAVERDGRPNVGSRVPERIFLLLSFLGGWPATLLMFVLLRHKVQKRGFLTVFLVLGAMGTFVWWGWLAIFECVPSPSRPVAP